MEALQTQNLFGVRDKVVLVTGGARGIGLMVRAHTGRTTSRDASERATSPQIASGFVANGARVYISSRKADACAAVAAQLTAAGPGTCVALPEDLSTLAACERLAARLGEREPALHCLVNNSGVAWGEPLATHSEKGLDRVYALNFKAIFFLSRALLPLLERGASLGLPSRIINIGSIAGIRPQSFPTYGYDSSKAAVHHLTLKLADEFATRHITVNAVAPGYVPSAMSAQLDAYTGDGDEVVKKIPLGRMGAPGDMAGATLFLASPAGAWVTGVILPVDGGFLARL